MDRSAEKDYMKYKIIDRITKIVVRECLTAEEAIKICHAHNVIDDRNKKEGFDNFEVKGTN